MNAPFSPTAITLRTVDLADANERARVDAFVSGHPQGTPFHLTAWTMAVAKGCGQVPHLIVAERGDGVLVGILPLTEVHSPLFGRALVSNGFAVDGGILSESDAATRALADAGWRLAQRLSCPTFELRGGAEPGSEWHINSDTYLGFSRPLASDDAAEMLAIPRKQRAEVRRAATFDLDVTTARDSVHAAAHYTLYAESVRNLGTPVFPARLFAEVLHAFEENADILTVSHRGVPVASVLSLYWKGSVYPYWGGGGRAARGLRANDHMYFALMGHARARGCTRFDFGRSKAGTGAAAFKRNWGFEGVPRSYYTRTADGVPAREINPLSPKYRLQVATWQRLPLGVANRVGPWIARGLG